MLKVIVHEIGAEQVVHPFAGEKRPMGTLLVEHRHPQLTTIKQHHADKQGRGFGHDADRANTPAVTSELNAVIQPARSLGRATKPRISGGLRRSAIVARMTGASFMDGILLQFGVSNDAQTSDPDPLTSEVCIGLGSARCKAFPVICQRSFIYSSQVQPLVGVNGGWEPANQSDARATPRIDGGYRSKLQRTLRSLLETLCSRRAG